MVRCSGGTGALGKARSGDKGAEKEEKDTIRPIGSLWVVVQSRLVHPLCKRREMGCGAIK